MQQSRFVTTKFGTNIFLEDNERYRKYLLDCCMLDARFGALSSLLRLHADNLKSSELEQITSLRHVMPVSVSRLFLRVSNASVR